ncbi:ABR165Wp [Eremothecium gossypii ATCC 10895]|uniref:Mediator of RNA polymerase II transcription subunit 17 n=1 Tax=Eremothecium gossypii (strain ATCC 10895 / CBS 109.51 / FGSC 9923 / NRRL Y-1056) TaxID=284811 RepID=MED17_EREGS|nr:ABR165Wp [Eremothecium gossypii ATCC 10895]Q75D58.1 RecName: Full=Mediator of RNA polymerase II transcription subunit 17; AltName: Full=Mediator complex subunit 17 [Eremothecium gossypii ATCC 10895]AAS50937.1 ABR165Wp [Eremothecium gossypii ATCC 10895]AEY95227.1 FABR165Wp [Eremothecium gossypii FDAG1]
MEPDDGHNSLNQDNGIPIVLDPNLINLRSRAASATVTTNGTTADSSEDSGSQQSVSSAPIQQNSEEHSLVSNPYETYGRMPLQKLIPLILQMRNASSFSELTEEDLLRDIEREEKGILTTGLDVEGDIEMGDADEESDLKPQEITDDDSNARLKPNNDSAIPQEEFNQMKREVLEHINLALNESSLSLEFISLLLSSVRPSVGVGSMSPFLKRSVPTASLNADKVELPPKNKTETLTLAVINRGWKLRSLEDSKALLKENYAKLQKSLEVEHAHWAMISQHISSTDVVFKMRDRQTGKRSLAVKYGYEDSGSLYKQDRGVAVLRHNMDLNKLELVPISNSKEEVHITANSVERFMRVHIYTKIEEEDDYILSGESSIDDQSLLQPCHDDISRQIARLKFFIFERELMYQLKKEAVSLMPYGVNFENENKVVLESPGERIEFEMVPLDDSALLSTHEPRRVNDKRANIILILLRMLLVVIHKKQLRRGLKPATSKHKYRADGDLLLLRPVLGRIRHRNYLQVVKRVVTECVLNIVPGSSIELLPQRSEPDTLHAREANIASLNKQIGLFDKILRMPRSELRTSLGAKGVIDLTLKSSNYCNAIIQVIYADSAGKTVFDTVFTELKELEEFLHFIVSEYVL